MSEALQRELLKRWCGKDAMEPHFKHRRTADRVIIPDTRPNARELHPALSRRLPPTSIEAPIQELEETADSQALGWALEQFQFSRSEPLEQASRNYFEQVLHSDFSRVRIHVGGDIADAARVLHADAFTVGNHVGFRVGMYSPDTSPGRALLGHELAHVVQQQHSGVALQRRVFGLHPEANAPHESDPNSFFSSTCDSPQNMFPMTSSGPLGGFFGSLLEVTGREGWQELVRLSRQEAPNDHDLIVDLLDILRPALIHRRSDQDAGILDPRGSGRVNTDCHFTTALIVSVLRDLGVSAESKQVGDLLHTQERTGGHDFPWFPSIDRGLRHGDDLYFESYPSMLSSDLLFSESMIREHWRAILERQVEERRHRVEAYENSLRAPPSEEEMAANEEFVSHLGSVLDRTLNVPARGDSGEMVLVTIDEILDSCPAPLLALLREKAQEMADPVGWYFYDLPSGSVQASLDMLPWQVKDNPAAAVLVLPPELTEPLRLPPDKDQAILLCAHVLRLRLVEGW